jgi:hypothetical protein
MRISARRWNSIYPAVSQNNNHCGNRLGPCSILPAAAVEDARKRADGAPQHPRHAKNSALHRGPPSRRETGMIQNHYSVREIQSAGNICAARWNEGVGEHVRTRFHFGFERR